MIECTVCGTLNHPTEKFCVNCRAFLEWQDGAGKRTGAGQGAGTGTTPPARPTGGKETAAGTGSTARTGPATGDTGTATTGVDEAPTSPQAVRPSPEVRRRAAEPSPQPPVPARTDGVVPCPSCGVGNPAQRRFCQACAAPLQAGTVTPQPWWVRLRTRLTGRSRYAAGERRQHRVARSTRRLLKMTAALCLAAVLAVVGRPLAQRLIAELRDETRAHVPLSPDGFYASPWLPDSPPNNVCDGATNEYWAPSGPAPGAWVEVSFNLPVRLLDILVTPGVSIVQEQFLAHARPHELTVVATARDGRTITRRLDLRDQPGPQTFAFESPQTVRVRFVVRSTFGPTGSPSVAIGELEFRGRR